MLKLAGTSIITGAAQGIGRVIALAYAKAGLAAIAIVDIKGSQLQEVAAEARKIATNKNFEVVTIPTDVADEEFVTKIVKRAVNAFRRIDYASNVARRPESKRAQISADKTTEDFNFTNSVNIYGLFYCQREELKAMRKQELVASGGRPGVRGSIVNMSSVASAGIQTMRGCTVYVTGKHAAIGMTKCAAVDHAQDSIRVNAVLPALIRTSFLDEFKGIPNFHELMVDATATKKFGYPEEVADVVLFLNSPMASFVTGAVWVVDGGASTI